MRLKIYMKSYKSTIEFQEYLIQEANISGGLPKEKIDSAAITEGKEEDEATEVGLRKFCIISSFLFAVTRVVLNLQVVKVVKCVQRLAEIRPATKR